ncbi:MAG: ankyrin repeat domain-containing protein [Gammaproteobacteria bacterium]|nr:ankyrin repeat domain-containing protein [Gammaproteobacteria bacterium]
MNHTLGKSLVASFVLAMPLLVIAADDTRFIEAVANGDRETLRLLLDSPLDVNAAKADGTTALHHAAHRDDVEIARALIESGADASAANVYGITPLSLACTNRSAAMVNILLQGGADANAATWNGESVLMDCTRTGASEAVAELLAAGANPNTAESSKGQTPLMWGAAGGHAEITQLLIEHGADINAATKLSTDRVPNTCRICAWKPSPGGFTALMFAARSGDIATARALLEAGADINEATAEYGNPLVIASASGHEDLALYLLAAGADHQSSDENGVTALHHAHQNGLASIHGVTYDPVYRVRPDNLPRLARTLLEAGGDPNAQIRKSYRIGPAIRSSCESVRDMVGATPFMLAAISADVSTLQLLGEFGADPSLGTSDGTTPLMAAARAACTGSNQADNLAELKKSRSLEAVKTIVAMGVDVDAVDKNGETAMHKAAFSGADNVVRYLADNGAGIDVRSKSGETPWSMASGISPSLQGRGEYGYHESTAELLLALGASEITRADMNVPDAYSNFLEREVSIDYETVTAQPD